MSHSSPPSEFTVAVVGATGLVGRKMIEVLAERNFPVGRLVAIASDKSLGKTVEFNGKNWPVREADAQLFEQVDIALFSAGKTVSRELAPPAAQLGAVVVDNSSAWRMDPDIPLVVPEVNPAALETDARIIANPNCSTIQMVVALQPLHRRFGLKRVVVSTYQAVSGSGGKALRQLQQEILSGKSADPAYPHPIANNCLPHIDKFNPGGYTGEELKMIRETRKIMNLPELAITATTVRVPVEVGHSEAVTAEFEKAVDPAEAREILRNSSGITVQDDPARNLYPQPLYCRDRDEVFVGRIRRDESVKNGLHLWIVADNLRKGAATNAVQIAELLIEKGHLNRRRA